jgi:CheY-like chemotaxis protein
MIDETCEQTRSQRIVLHVEDDAEDALFLRYSFEQAGLNYRFYQVTAGEQAIDYLSGTGPYTNRQQYPLPDMILLDLKMPRKTGFDVLNWIRQQESFKGLPVIVLTSSDRHADLHRARFLGATSYLTKTVSCKNVMELLDSLAQQWK